MADPDPTFYVDADPDLDLDPNFILIWRKKLFFKSSSIYFKNLKKLVLF